MTKSNQNTSAVGTEYQTQNPTTPGTAPTIYARSCYENALNFMDVYVLNTTPKRIDVIVCLYSENERYTPVYSLNRADLEAGKPCTRQLVLQGPKHRAKKGEPLKNTTSCYNIEFSFSEEVANAAAQIGYEFEEAIRIIFKTDLNFAKYNLQLFARLGMPIPVDNQLRTYVEDLASTMASIPTEEVPKVE